MGMSELANKMLIPRTQTRLGSSAPSQGQPLAPTKTSPAKKGSSASPASKALTKSIQTQNHVLLQAKKDFVQAELQSAKNIIINMEKVSDGKLRSKELQKYLKNSNANALELVKVDLDEGVKMLNDQVSQPSIFH